MIDYDFIQEQLSDIRSAVSERPVTLTDEIATAIETSCDCIETEIEDDTSESVPSGLEEIVEMIPTDLSLGEVISLKDTINDWRRNYGYPEV